MKYRKLGNSDLNVSVVGAGTWAIGGDSWGAVEDAASIKALHKAIDCGMNLIDTAPPYGSGHSEEVVGEVLKTRRSEVIVATKCGTYKDGARFYRDLKPQNLAGHIDDSLKRLGIEQIDLLQIHWPDLDTPLADTLPALKKEQEKGKFRYLGVSNFDGALMDETRQYMDLISLQPPYSLLKREVEDGILPYCAANNIGTLTYGSIGAGALTDKYINTTPTFEEGDVRGGFYPWFKKEEWPKVAELLLVLKKVADKYGVPVSYVAINWVLSQTGVTCALVGLKTEAQAIENAAAGDFELSAEDVATITAACNRIYNL